MMDQLISRSLLATILAVLSLLPAGCGGKSQSGPKDKNAPPKAGEVLQRMLTSYRQAKSYSDRGTLTLSYTQNGTTQRETVDMALQVQRPNKFHLKVYQVESSSDGKLLRAFVRDSASDNIGQQLLERPVGEQPIMSQLMADSVVSNVLVGGRAGLPVPLELLLGEDPLGDFLSKDFKKELLDGGSVDSHACHRLQVASEKLKFVLWIDKKTYALRQIDYPANRFAEDLVNNPNAQGVELTATFKDAQLNASLSDSDFEFKAPAGATKVRFFVVPPRANASPLLGETPTDYFFTSADRGRVDRKQLDGKVTSIVWFHDDIRCEQYMREFNKVATEYASNSKFAFLGAFTKPSRFTDSMLDDLKKKWELSFPVVRDLKAFGRDVFRVPVAPTLVVMDGKGRVHIVEPRANLEIAKQLPAALDDILAGKDVAAQVKGMYDRIWSDYRRNLNLATGKVQQDRKEALLPKQPPLFLELKQRWEHPAAATANLVAESDGIFCITNGREILELDTKGQLIATHKLDHPSEEKVTSIRTAGKGDKRRFAVWRFGGRQVHVYDHKWKHSFSYPPTEQDHQGVNDAQLGDLEQDKKIELLIGFWGLTGVHKVDMTGKRVWGFRGVNNVYSVGLSPPNVIGWSKVVVCGEKGSLFQLNQFGNADPEIRTAHAIHHIFGSTFSSGASFCGISLARSGQIVGFDAEFTELWSSPLAKGTFSSDVQFVQSGSLFSKDPQNGEWLIAAPNGSVTIISNDGNFSDRIAFGEHVRGLAGVRDGDRALLVVASPDAVRAYELTKK